MKIEIVTKDGIEKVKEYSRIIFESVDGDIEILEGHAPMLAFLMEGELKFYDEDKEDVYQAGEGVLEVQNNKVRILVDYLKSKVGDE